MSEGITPLDRSVGIQLAEIIITRLQIKLTMATTDGEEKAIEKQIRKVERYIKWLKKHD